MIEGIIAELSLAQWNTLLGISAAIVTVVVGLVKLRKKFYLWFYLKPKRCILRCRVAKDKARAHKIFEEIKPMLEQEIMDTLEGYTAVMQEQRITIAGAIAEGVEFRNFVTGSIAVLHDTMTKVADVVEINSKDAKAIRERLSTRSCDIAGGCSNRVLLKENEDNEDES